MTDRRFGVSTHLFHEDRLAREHLVHIAAHGFDAVEVFATRSHFDYTNGAAVDQLAEWLSDTRLELHSLHAPVIEALRAGQWVAPLSNATPDQGRRQAAVSEAAAALQIARKIPFHYLVVHLGVPDAARNGGPDNEIDAACRSLQTIAELAAEHGVRVALEVIPNPLSSAAALVRLIEDRLDGLDVGICLDYGHAHLMGDLSDAIETLSGHLWTTHVHDNQGRRDDHLVPFAGTIDWAAALMETQKIGYDGIMLFEVGGGDDPLDVLRRTVRARERLEKIFA